MRHSDRTQNKSKIPEILRETFGEENLTVIDSGDDYDAVVCCVDDFTEKYDKIIELKLKAIAEKNHTLCKVEEGANFPKEVLIKRSANHSYPFYAKTPDGKRRKF